MNGKRPPYDEQKALFESQIAAQGITTLAGEATGLSLIDAGLAGAGANSFVSMMAVIHPGDPTAVDSRDITAFNDVTGEVTVASAFKGGQVAAGTPYKIVTFRFVPAEVAALAATTDNILLDTQIRVTPAGVKAINAGITKYLHIDSGTNGAEILAIIIEGVIGHAWTLDVYVPAADGEAATQAKSKRDAITYGAADTEGGLLKPFGIAFDAYLNFTNDGANDQIDQVTVVYRSRGALTLTWEA